MARDFEFVADRAGIRRLLADVDMTGVLRKVGNDIRAGIERHAPDGGPSTGFRESIRVGRPEVDRDQSHIDIYSTDPFAHLVEWGSINNPPYAPFRRALDDAGLRVDQGRR